jgi:SAM-dependent methyltransferase
MRVASLACGYLREAELMSSIELGRLDRYYALDQDAECVQHVSQTFRDTPVTAMSASVRDLLKRTSVVEEVCDLDFFYAAGIFDYLTDPMAEALAAELFRRLKPGGVLWIPNFVPDIPDRAYMEAFMDWWLIYRSADALGRLDARIPEREIAGKRLFVESEENVTFLELVRTP